MEPAAVTAASSVRPTATLQLRLGLALIEATEVTPILPSHSSPTALLGDGGQIQKHSSVMKQVTEIILTMA